MTQLRGVHPRLITETPGPRGSLAMLPPLKELGDDFAWALWYSVRRAFAFDILAAPTEVPDPIIAERFRAAAAAVPEVAPDLEILEGFATGSDDQQANSNAFMRIGEWLALRPIAEPAIECVEAAVALVPQSAARALAAGRMNRQFGDVARAEVFYARAIALARRSRKWRTYVRAHLGMGQVKKSVGDTGSARAHYFTAARAARSLSGEKWLAAQTQHDLLVLAGEEGAFNDALRHARRALDWYPRHHARFPALAHDLGFVLVRMRLYARAVPLLTAVMRTQIPPADQVIGWSTLACAAAGSGDADGFDAAAERALRLVGLFDMYAAAAFANLAHGAYLLRRWDNAEQYGERSLQISKARMQAEAADVARSILADVHARHVPLAGTDLEDQQLTRVLRLTDEIGSRLEAWRGVSWRRKRQSGPEHVGRL